MNKILALLLKLQSNWTYWVLCAVMAFLLGLPIGYFINKFHGTDDNVVTDFEPDSGVVLSSSKVDELIHKANAIFSSFKGKSNNGSNNDNNDNDDDNNDDNNEDNDDDLSGINTPPVILFTDTSFISARYKYGQNVNISVRVIDNDLKYTRLFVNGVLLSEVIEKPVHTFILIKPALGIYEVQVQAIDKVNQSAKTPKHLFFVEVEGDIISPIISSPLSNPTSIILSTPLSNGMSRPISETLSLITSNPLSLIISPEISNPLSEIISEIVSNPISQITSNPLSEIISDIVSNPISKGISDIISNPLSDIVSDIVSTPISDGISNIVSNPISNVVSNGISQIISNPLSEIISDSVSNPLSEVISDIVSTPISEGISDIISTPLSKILSGI